MWWVKALQLAAFVTIGRRLIFVKPRMSHTIEHQSFLVVNFSWFIKSTLTINRSCLVVWSRNWSSLICLFSSILRQKCTVLQKKSGQQFHIKSLFWKCSAFSNLLSIFVRADFLRTYAGYRVLILDEQTSVQSVAYNCLNLYWDVFRNG